MRLVNEGAGNRDVETGAASWRRSDGIDLIRGLAILFVLMNHVNMQLIFAHVPYTKGLPAQLVSSLVWNGQYGVQMFFAVSGFLITMTSLRRWGSLGAVQVFQFYRLRFARIAPLFFLLLAILSILHIARVDGFIIRQKVASLGTALLAAVTFRINVLEATRGYLPGAWDILWSLSVEEMFYLFFPLVCLIFKRLRFLVPVLAVFVVLGPFARVVVFQGNEVWREYSYLGAMDAIALGSLTALFLSHVRLGRRTRWAFGIAGSAAMLFILLLSQVAAAMVLKALGLDMTLLAVGTCMLVAVAVQMQWRSPVILTPLRWMGQHSYEIYLSHMFVVVVLFRLYLRLGKPLAWVPVVFLAVIVGAGILGALVARFYTEPLNHFLRGTSRWRMGHVLSRVAR